MELKAKEDMHEAKYPTQEESKLNLWRLIIGSKNVGIGVLCAYLLLNASFAEIIDPQFIQLEGETTFFVPTFKDGIVVGVGLTLFVLLILYIIVEVIKNIVRKATVLKKNK